MSPAGKAVTVIGAILLAVIVMAILAVPPDRSNQSSIRSQRPSQGATEPAIGAHGPNPVSEPEPLQFHSSGRLPITIRGLTLGMTISEVFAKHPELENLDNSKPIDLSSRDGVSLWHSVGAGNLGVFAYLNGGRLYSIETYIDRLSPADAQSFQNDTLDQLGQPDAVVKHSDEEMLLVWVDGDVRIQFRNWSLGPYCRSQTRCMRLTVTVWPAQVRAFLSANPRFGKKVRDFDLKLMRTKWADFTLPAIVMNPLPESLAGVRLRMEPWEVRAAAPGIELGSTSPEIIKGVLKYGDSSSLETHMWRGRVANVWLMQRALSVEEWYAYQSSIEHSFGPPELLMPFEVPALTAGPEPRPIPRFKFRDDRVEFSVIFLHDRKVGNLEIDQFLVDRQLEGEENEWNCLHAPPHYAPSPETKSFFAAF
jgi:hypothetical protein